MSKRSSGADSKEQPVSKTPGSGLCEECCVKMEKEKEKMRQREAKRAETLRALPKCSSGQCMGPGAKRGYYQPCKAVDCPRVRHFEKAALRALLGSTAMIESAFLENSEYYTPGQVRAFGEALVDVGLRRKAATHSDSENEDD